jgi:hypothetical protein
MTDSLSTMDLVALVRAEAVNDDGDPDVYWELVSALRDRDPHEVWAQLVPLAKDKDVRLQQMVPDVLRGLGREAQPLANETLQLFGQMLATHPSAEVVACIANACVDFHHGSVVTMLVPYAGHERVEVREGVLHAVRRSSRPEARWTTCGNGPPSRSARSGRWSMGPRSARRWLRGSSTVTSRRAMRRSWGWG